MDWDPASPIVARAAQPAPAQPSATPARKKAASAARPAAAAATPPAVTPAPTAPDTANDPWARAVEQAPGIWTIGSDSNVGSYAPGKPVTPEPEPEPEPPHYAPAAAQVPHYAAAVPATAPYEPLDSSSSNGWGDSAELVAVGAPSLSASANSAPTAAHASSAAAAPTAAPTPPTASPAMATAAPPAPPSAGRQSLYQRLSNSPEAEAGRAKAPARAAATTTYVQDIPSADDETIEESGVFGRAAVERILGGKLVEERSLDGSPLPPRS